jgi:hypothetical protein
MDKTISSYFPHALVLAEAWEFWNTFNATGGESIRENFRRWTLSLALDRLGRKWRESDPHVAASASHTQLT